MAKKVIEEQKTSKVISFDPNPRIRVSFSRTIQLGDEWNKAEAGIEINIISLEKVKEEFEELWEVVGPQIENILPDKNEHPEDEEEEDEEVEEDEEDDADIPIKLLDHG